VVNISKIRFTKHALEKFKFLKEYSFEINREQVIEAILNPNRLDRKNNQFFALKILDSKHCLRVVYEKRKGFLVIITFYPVRRKRYGL